MITDYLIFDEIQGPDYKNLSTKEFWMKVVRNLQPGVTELYIHPNHATDEARAITGSWRTREAELNLFTSDADMRKLLADEGIILISYRPLLELQRRSRP